MSVTNYLNLSQEEQIELVQLLVPAVLDQYGIHSINIENVNHGFNSSFRVKADSDREYSLRINTNSKKTPTEVAGEVQLLQALASRSFFTPVPVMTVSGNLFVEVYAPFLERSVLCVLYDWIDGGELGDDASDEELFELGAIMARMHTFAMNLPSKLASHFPRIDRTLFNSPDNLRRPDTRLDREIRSLIDQTFERVDSVFAQLQIDSPLIVIHADLHPYNVLRTPNGLAVIDFDDVGVGVPLQDFAITSFYLRDRLEGEEAVKAGYLSQRELPHYEESAVEALLAARQLLLLNDLLDVSTAEEIAFTPTYIERTRKRLQHFLHTGSFELIMD